MIIATDQIALLRDVMVTLTSLTDAIKTAANSAVIASADVVEESKGGNNWKLKVRYGGDKKLNAEAVSEIKKDLGIIIENLNETDFMDDDAYDVIDSALGRVNKKAKELLVAANYGTEFTFPKATGIGMTYKLKSITAAENSSHQVVITQTINDGTRDVDQQAITLAYANGPDGEKGEERFSGVDTVSDGGIDSKLFITGNMKLAAGSAKGSSASRTEFSGSVTAASAGIKGCGVSITGAATSIGCIWNEYVCALASGSLSDASNYFSAHSLKEHWYNFIPGLTFVALSVMSILTRSMKRTLTQLENRATKLRNLANTYTKV